MPQLGNYQVGLLKSTPKLTKINGDDNVKVIWRNMGNNHAYPFLWSATATVASGVSTVTLASGVSFHGLDLATYANVNITPSFNAGAVYVTKNTTTNVITCTVETAPSTSSTIDVLFMLGAADVSITGVNCDGMWNSMPPTGYNS
jgi:hypothetical protein